MNPVILILRGKNPQIINVADGMTALNWSLPDGREVELEITSCCVSSPTGEQAFYPIATDMDDLSPRQIMQAVEELSLN